MYIRQQQIKTISVYKDYFYYFDQIYKFYILYINTCVLIKLARLHNLSLIKYYKNHLYKIFNHITIQSIKNNKTIKIIYILWYNKNVPRTKALT